MSQTIVRPKVLIPTAVVICLGLVGAVAFANFGRLVIAVLTPRVAFDPAHVPTPPSYADPAMWTALPARADAADAGIATLPVGDQAGAPVDVFYVHPTSYVGNAWNASLDDSTVNDATDKGATRIQASAFNACCAVYAPRYRQANLSAFVRPNADGRRAIALAGDDVVAAFRYYLDHHNQGRPFIIAAHSQGAVLAARLLKDMVVNTPLQRRLVVAYLIGSPLTEATLSNDLGLPACASSTDVGCVVAWNARSPAYRGGLDFVEFPSPPLGAAPSQRVCVNPLTWWHDEAAGGRELNRGAVFFDDSGTPPLPRSGFASAQCRDGTLIVEMMGTPPRDFSSRLLDHALGDGNYHPIEVGLFFVNLRGNAAERISATRTDK